MLHKLIKGCMAESSAPEYTLDIDFENIKMLSVCNHGDVEKSKKIDEKINERHQKFTILIQLKNPCQVLKRYDQADKWKFITDNLESADPIYQWSQNVRSVFNMNGSKMINEFSELQCVGTAAIANFWNINQVIACSGSSTQSKIEEMLEILRNENVKIQEQVNQQVVV